MWQRDWQREIDSTGAAGLWDAWPSPKTPLRVAQTHPLLALGAPLETIGPSKRIGRMLAVARPANSKREARSVANEGASERAGVERTQTDARNSCNGRDEAQAPSTSSGGRTTECGIVRAWAVSALADTCSELWGSQAVQIANRDFPLSRPFPTPCATPSSVPLPAACQRQQRPVRAIAAAARW